MDIGRSLTFLTEDESWIMKLVVGAVVMLLSILFIPMPLIVGYQVAVARRTMQGKELPLPEWGEDLGRLFMDGLMVMIAILVYTIPSWLLFCLGMFSVFGGFMLGDGELSGLLGASLFVTGTILICLFLVMAIAMMFISPAVVLQYVRTGELGATFRFGEVFGIARDNIGNILMTVVVQFVLSLVVSAIASIPCLGWIVAMAGYPYMYIVTGHLYGQIATNMDNKVSPQFG